MRWSKTSQLEKKKNRRKTTKEFICFKYDFFSTDFYFKASKLAIANLV